MKLASIEDYEYPHIDWVCVNGDCGAVYSSAGKPDTDHCPNGHEAIWRPNTDTVEEYIDLLESLDEGDGLVVCGRGPAPLKARVAEVGENSLRTESISSPARIIRWRDYDENTTVEFAKADAELQSFSDVYHVERVPEEQLVDDEESGSDPETETVELEPEEWDAVEDILDDRAEEEQYGAVPTNESVAAETLGQEIRDQREVDA